MKDNSLRIRLEAPSPELIFLMVCFHEVFDSPEIQEKLVVAFSKMCGVKGIPTELGM